MARKAQGGMEMIISLVMILLVLVIITSYSIEKAQESKDIKTLIDAKRVCTSIADNLDTIKQEGKGYYKYFSIPEQVEGGYDYNISINNNIVGISWGGNKSWAVKTIASNVTIYCMDYGLNQTNRVLNEGNSIKITCYRPNIRPIEDSVRYWNNNGNVTISLKVENEGHVRSTGFNVSVYGTSITVGGLEPYDWIEVNHTIENFPTGGYLVVITADSGNVVYESIESDNTISRTITI